MVEKVVIDGNNVGRIFSDATKLSYNGKPTAGIIGCIKQAREMKVGWPKATQVWCWDGRAQWRYDVHPDYKSKRNMPDPRRDAQREGFKQQAPIIWDALSSLGMQQMKSHIHEADDLAGLLIGAAKRANPDAKLVAVSGDGDWIQLVRDGVEVHHPTEPSKVYKLSNLMDKTGYRTPYGYLEGKCLHGDGSDDIPGVGGIGEKGAPLFIAEFGGVRQFWQAVDAGEFKPKKKAHINLASPEGRAAFGRNLRLMQLIKPIPVDRTKLEFHPGKFDADKFHEICSDYGFLSILRNFEEFIAPFKG